MNLSWSHPDRLWGPPGPLSNEYVGVLSLDINFESGDGFEVNIMQIDATQNLYFTSAYTYMRKYCDCEKN
jgi:hypothetical protein